MTRRLAQTSPSAALTAWLSGSIAGLRDEDCPPAALETVRRGLTDGLGVLVAGSGEPVVGLIDSTFAGFERGPTQGEARLLPRGERRSASHAALVNGVAAHVLDFDDVALDGHPTAVLMPALMAEAEAQDCCAADLTRGYIAGYETWATLWSAAPEPLHGRGWHPSGVFGAVAAAAACAALHRLSERQTADAIGLAVAQAGGVGANFGTMAKSFQVGRAAAAGVASARLARAGVDASPQAIEHPAGFLAAFAGGARPVAGGFGRPDWAILREGLDIKAYPVCYAVHRLIDAALDLRAAGSFDPAAISTINVRLGRLQSDILHSRRPRTALEAKFSAEFAVAAALTFGTVGLAELDDAVVRRTDIEALIGRVERRIDAEMGEPPFSPFDQVAIRLADGRSLESRPVREATGSRHNPPSRQQAWTKFAGATAGRLPAEQAERLFDGLWRLDPGEPIVHLLDLCTSASGTR